MVTMTGTMNMRMRTTTPMKMKSRLLSLSAARRTPPGIDFLARCTEGTRRGRDSDWNWTND